MMKMFKKITALVIASIVALTTSSECFASKYHFYGNEYFDTYGTSFGALVNVCQFIVDSPYADTYTGDIAGYINDLAIQEDPEALANDFMQNGLTYLLDNNLKGKTNAVFKFALQLVECGYAFSDLGIAISELSNTINDTYKQIIISYYTSPVKGINSLCSIVSSKAINNEPIKRDVAEKVQDYINSHSESVQMLRSYSKDWKYRSHRNELQKCADSLEKLINSANVLQIYADSFLLVNDYSSIFVRSSINKSGSLATIAMSYNMLTNSKVDESYIVGLNYKNSSEAYWTTIETALKLKDNIMRLRNLDQSTKVKQIGSFATSAKSGVIIQIDKINSDSTRYILCVGMTKDDLRILNPNGSSNATTLKRYCDSNGLNYSTTIERINTVWSYTRY